MDGRIIILFLLMISLVHVHAAKSKFESYLETLEGSAVSFAGAISAQVLLLTLGSFALKSLSTGFLLLNSLLVVLFGLLSGLNLGLSLFIYFILITIVNSCFFIVRIFVKNKINRAREIGQKSRTFFRLRSENETRVMDLDNVHQSAVLEGSSLGRSRLERREQLRELEREEGAQFMREERATCKVQ